MFERSTLYPNVLETLDELRARGMALGCVTNKRLEFANGLLERAGIVDRFAFVFGGDSFGEKKPSPMQLDRAAALLGVAAQECALVGDSVHDEQAAAAAGFRFVWAAYGYGTPRADDSSTVRIERFSELSALFLE